MFLEQLPTKVIMFFLFLKISPQWNDNPKTVASVGTGVWRDFRRATVTKGYSYPNPSEDKETQNYMGLFSHKPYHGLFALSRFYKPSIWSWDQTNTAFASSARLCSVQGELTHFLNSHADLMNSANQMMKEPESKNARGALKFQWEQQVHTFLNSPVATRILTFCGEPWMVKL